MSDKKVSRWMKKNVVSISEEATLKDAASLLAEKRVGTLPVVDETGKMVGLISMRGLVSFFLPDFIRLVEDVDFVQDYGALADLSEEDIERANSMKVKEIMDEPMQIKEDCSLVRALSMMSTHDTPDLTVVRDDKPVGIVSRVDIGRGFFESWLQGNRKVKGA
ncbi:MAG: CBS domain-containing protein [Chloroflexi bacterium]|nr:CBS domain-containing protein [Chloroflexota bacterium]MQC26744.1 CBS domain-containing protein [Chloroflexota bacterium]